MSKRHESMNFLFLLNVLFGLSIMLAACGGGGGGGTGLPTATYSLSGKVSGDIKQGVTIAVSGAMSASVATDANGNYSVSSLPNGSYTVTPSKAGYTFAQASRSVVIKGADASGNDFTANAVLYGITGTISGAVQAGVTITVTGTTDGGSPLTINIITTTSSYSVTNIPNGSYTVTPAESGYAFSPSSVAVTIMGGNGSAAFTSSVDNSVKFNLSGTVSGDTQADVTITFTGSGSGSVKTLANGTYTIPNLPNGTYAVSASKPGYTFNGPLSATINNADSTGNNFSSTAVLYSISGSVSGDVQNDVTITVTGYNDADASFGPVETTTSGNGSYSVTGIRNGNYTVVATKLGYLFNPTSKAAAIQGANSTGNNFTASTNPVMAFNANGGQGTAGNGGNGGQLYAESYGSIKVLKSGTVDASFTVPTITPDFGTIPFTVSADTTVSTADEIPNVLCQISGGDGSLYIGDGDGICGDSGDIKVTGLTVAAGVTLILDDPQSKWGSLRLAKDLVLNGTLVSGPSSTMGLSVGANSIEVGIDGKITSSALPGSNNSGGQVYLGLESGLTNIIINRGTIEAKGDGSGHGGYIYLESDDLVVNYGIIDVSGGNNGGYGGEFDAYVGYGDFYSSGTVRMNGGNGDIGGEAESLNNNKYWWTGYSCWIETVSRGNTNGRNGDIIISGTWEAKGGDGANGSGGNGGYMYFQADGMGTVMVNAHMSVKGGTGAGSSGGSAGEIEFVSYLNAPGYNDPTPGTIGIAGTYDLRGGDSDQSGGSGGNLEVLSQGVNSSVAGSDVEFIAFPVVVMNGGVGGTNGGSASDNALNLYTYSYDGSTPAKLITNEADIQAKGGNATQANSTGGMGGSVDVETGIPGDTTTVVNNSGNIDVSGGNGTSGGGSGGNITLTSNGASTSNTGTLSVSGGTPGGTNGVKTIDYIVIQ